jgi:hypothetical protein
MSYQSNEFEKRAQADIFKLKQKYVIDVITAERIQDILIYLYLSQGSKNQRGINLQTEKLKSALHNCPRIVAPVFSAPTAMAQSAHA